MNTTLTIAEQRVVLAPVCWATYVALTEEAQIGGRVTYDQGRLEIMSPMLSHESAKALIGRMIEQFTLSREIDIRSSASTTFRRQDLSRGFEADESYYISHASDLRGKEEIDLSIDPPPDLVVEIDITRSSLNKRDLFASMGIPEVWRYNGRELSIEVLAGEAYRNINRSDVLPGFPRQQAEELLAQRTEESETVLMRRFLEQLKTSN